MSKFDLKTFNPEAFGAYVNLIPKTRRNELIRSRAIRPTSQFRTTLAAQTAGNVASFPIFGRIGGAAQNYDGETDIVASGTTTFERSVIVVGRANSWVERDFSEDITGGAGFMSNVARQVGEYWQGVDQDTLLQILVGIFSMTGTENERFIERHTMDISSDANPNVGLATLNKAMQRAAGDNKQIFGLAIMHSEVATNLENERLFKNLTQTDANGVTRDLGMATWNGRLVLIDDGMPAIDLGGGSLAFETYVLGDGAFDYDNVGAEVPYEMVREAKTNGGQTSLVSRQRKVFAPNGISFTKNNMASKSPTTSELKDGDNWELVNDANGEYIDHKAIPIARIISRG
ncbi:MAG: phage coat protein [Defluviitaleaceae bacterium]|nr:phage coat protein [Defluviitaleaceae bacterium]